MNKFAMRSDKPTNQHKNRISVGGVFVDMDKTPPPAREEEILPTTKVVAMATVLQDEVPAQEPIKDFPTVVSLPVPKKPQLKPQAAKEDRVDVK